MINQRIEKILTKTGYTSELEKHETISYIEKLEKVLKEIKEYCNGAYETSCYTKNVCLVEENIEDILQIITKALGDEDNE